MQWLKENGQKDKHYSRNLKIEQHEPNKNPLMNSCVQWGSSSCSTCHTHCVTVKRYEHHRVDIHVYIYIRGLGVAMVKVV